eukprot:TRINITY_DN1610_c0_g1_i2.p1 TRINITY_DN1610_c0_g1~~TRINITY_DN1610_c0_g1_i2.p1  ORF type:complete len:672 (+),score=78.85 TRINITY_DN1610_c0_g1_i2:55-2016(+)
MSVGECRHQGGASGSRGPEPRHGHSLERLLAGDGVDPRIFGDCLWSELFDAAAGCDRLPFYKCVVKGCAETFKSWNASWEHLCQMGERQKQHKGSHHQHFEKVRVRLVELGAQVGPSGTPIGESLPRVRAPPPEWQRYPLPINLSAATSIGAVLRRGIPKRPVTPATTRAAPPTPTMLRSAALPATPTGAAPATPLILRRAAPSSPSMPVHSAPLTAAVLGAQLGDEDSDDEGLRAAIRASLIEQRFMASLTPMEFRPNTPPRLQTVASSISSILTPSPSSPAPLSPMSVTWGFSPRSSHELPSTPPVLRFAAPSTPSIARSQRDDADLRAALRASLQAHQQEQTSSISTASGSSSSNSRGHNTAATDEPITSEAGACIICMDASATHLAVPCGHQCVCVVCARRVATCPICRKYVVQFVKVFASGIKQNDVEKGKDKEGETKNKKDKKDKKEKKEKKERKEHSKHDKKHKKEQGATQDPESIDRTPARIPPAGSDGSLEVPAPSNESVGGTSTGASASARTSTGGSAGSSEVSASARELAGGSARTSEVPASVIDALSHEMPQGCSTCQARFGQICWSTAKKTYTTRCVGAKKHAFDLHENRWMSERQRQQRLRESKGLSASQSSAATTTAAATPATATNVSGEPLAKKARR